MRAASVSRRFDAARRPTMVDDALGRLAVVHGVGDVVGSRRRGAVSSMQREVDDEVLALAALFVVHAVVPEDAQPGQCDLVHRSPCSPLPSCRRDAQRVDGVASATSCTRTAHTPACAASTLVTAVARSRRSSR